ncbi:AraC family transcriptional regulator [Modestobacter roseus]|uniref:AraC family transcriptional regulator n=1 Tax=Modestobacter roseus TaxID=1181884 RepID=UPI0034DFDB9D
MGADRRRSRVLEGYLDTRRAPARPARDAVLVRCQADVTVARSWRLRDVDCCLIEGADVDVVPYRRNAVPRPGADERGIALGFVAAGSMQITQDRHSVTLRRGQVGLYDGLTPFALHSEVPHRYLVAHLRRQVVRLRPEDRDSLMARDLSAFVGAAALGALLATVVEVGEDPMPAAGQHLGDAILACVLAIVAESRGPAVGERSSLLFGELADWLDAHLPDDLSTERLAAEHFLSARYVRKLFADHGTTVTAHIRDRRLERIRDELLAPWNADVPVSAIAARWGMRDPSAFSRAFTRQFGEAPAGFRSRAVRRPQDPAG